MVIYTDIIPDRVSNYFQYYLAPEYKALQNEKKSWYLSEGQWFMKYQYIFNKVLK